MMIFFPLCPYTKEYWFFPFWIVKQTLGRVAWMSRWHHVYVDCVLLSLRTVFGSHFRRRLAFITRCLLIELLKSQGNLTLLALPPQVFFSHVVIYSTGLLELKSHQQQIHKQDLIWDLEQSCSFFWPGLLLCTDKDLAGGSNLLTGVSWYSVWLDLVSSNTSRAVWLLSVQGILSATF